MTQAQLAERIGMTQLHYGRLERGERNVSLTQLDRIAELFGVPVKALLRGAFPDEKLDDDGKEETSNTARDVEHMMQSMNDRECEIILHLCRIMAHGNDGANPTFR